MPDEKKPNELTLQAASHSAITALIDYQTIAMRDMQRQHEIEKSIAKAVRSALKAQAAALLAKPHTEFDLANFVQSIADGD